jgi:hypothetical protein
MLPLPRCTQTVKRTFPIICVAPAVDFPSCWALVRKVPGADIPGMSKSRGKSNGLSAWHLTGRRATIGSKPECCSKYGDPRGSGHTPVTQVRLLHDDQALAVIFRVEDRYVLARSTAYQLPTHKDSCVEFFVRPRPDRGYFNFEFNSIGTLLLWYVEKPRGPDGVFEKYTQVPEDIANTVECARRWGNRSAKKIPVPWSGPSPPLSHWRYSKDSSVRLRP